MSKLKAQINEIIETLKLSEHIRLYSKNDEFTNHEMDQLLKLREELDLFFKYLNNDYFMMGSSLELNIESIFNYIKDNCPTLNAIKTSIN